ncbi:MAG: TonB family protein [Chlorobi bacterium]|nr:TonB family protein [Chlorobiota bacterium]
MNHEETLKEERRAKRLSVLFTSLFFILVIIILFFVGLWKPWPPPPEEGVMVAFGEIENVEVGGVPETSPTPPAPSQPEVPQKDVMTQDIEDAPVIEENTDPKPKESMESPEPNPELVDQPAQEPEEETPKIDPSALYTGPRGTLDKPGEGGGKPSGSHEGKGNTGNTGVGTSGIGYSLIGRTLKRVPQIKDESQETGIVVIRIKVDQQGRVVSAEFSPAGSTTTNQRLISLALQAAKQARFNPDPNAPQFQYGTMTFHFRVD